MTPDRWRKINEVFQAAVELDPAAQAEFLNTACENDESFRKEVDSLLAANIAAGGTFIAGNAAQDATGLLEDNETLSGKTLEHYTIISEIGAGGMGKVFLARDSKLNRPIAIKTLPNSLAQNSEYVRRFQKEAQAAATLNHPNVATIFSVEDTDGQLFITMEYVEGKTLAEVFSGGKLDIKQFLDWFSAIADALAHAHDKGIIHRDIKPGNIMITSSGIPKILDFGLARFDRTSHSVDHVGSDITKTGQVLGTPAYMSPEQAEGKNLDRRTDIFSIGVVMYQAITGEKPFKGDNYASIISKLMTHKPRNVIEINPDIPPLISRLIMKCLNKDPQYRYQSMDEVRVLLNETRSALDSGVSLLSAGETAKVSKMPRFAAYAVPAILLIGAGFLAAWGYFSTGDSAAADSLRFSIRPPDGQALGLFHADLSPDGKTIVFVTRQTNDKLLHIRHLDSLDTIPLSGTGDARNPFFSADSKWIGFFTGEKTMKKVAVAGGDPLTICESCPSDSSAYWSADDRIIASDTEGLYSISSSGGTPKRLTKINREKNEIAHHSPQLLPDNTSVLYTVQNQKLVKIAVYSLKTGKSTEIYEIEGGGSDHGRASFAQYIPTGHLIFSRGKQLLAVEFELNPPSVKGAPISILDGMYSVPNFKVSSNGTLVYLPEAPTRNNLLVWVGRDGKETPVFEKKGSYMSPRISPDGSRVAVQENDDIWVYEVKDGRGVRLTFKGENQVPIWTPDGKSIIYAAKNEDVWSIQKESADGTGTPEKLFSSENRHFPYSWHPTKPQIAIASVPGVNNSDISLLSIADGKVSPILVSPYKEDTPRYSPDGKWLAYFSTESGSVKVYVQSAEVSGNKTTVSKGAGMFPVWSPTGSEIFFRQGSGLVAVDVSTAGEFRVGESRTLFSGKYLTSFDVSRDGSRFLMVKNEAGSMPTHINVVVGWTREFKEILKSKN